MQQKQIAEKLSQTEASISRQIKLMQRGGLLQSTRNPENRREHITNLTDKGNALIDRALGLLNEYYTPVFDKLSSGQQQTLREALALMRQELCLEAEVQKQSIEI